MKKKTWIAITTALAVLLFGFSYSFATNNIGQEAVDGVRNVVGGAENIVEDAAGGIASGVKNGVSDVTNGARNIANGAMTSDNTGNGGYNATRTATTRTMDATSSTFLGMGATAWGWLIMAIVGIITVALVWYYGKEHEENYTQNDSRY